MSAQAERPLLRGRRKYITLALAAIAASGAAMLADHLSRRTIHREFSPMLTAARTMQHASQIIRAEKEARGLMQPPAIDPNQTGMIGHEYTSITTTLGDIGSKRTATNPDLAAVLVRLLSSLDLPRGAPVVMITSGSFVGGNVAAIAAAESLGLKPFIIASLSSSMYGANDPDFNWLDMLTLLRQKGILRSSPIAAVIGGEGATGASMDREGRLALAQAAQRHGVELVEKRPWSALVDELMTRVDRALPAGAKAAVVVNVGGAIIGLGTCRESYELPPGLTRAVSCHDGVPGLAFRLAENGTPMLNVINFRRLAVEFGLPFDPVPLPAPGNNPSVYGSMKNGPN